MNYIILKQKKNYVRIRIELIEKLKKEFNSERNEYTFSDISDYNPIKAVYSGGLLHCDGRYFSGNMHDEIRYMFMETFEITLPKQIMFFY